MRDQSRLPVALRGLRLPLVGAPMFLVSGPELVIAQCKAGIIGAFPALNAREAEGEPIALERWLDRITEELARHDRDHPERPAAPFAVNQIVHRSNTRLERDVEICRRHRVPIWITSLGARPEVNEAAHSCGGIVLHDVVNDRFARKAVARGADGLIAVAAGAGGHAGAQSPFALTAEIRAWFDGPLLLSGAIATGRALLAARALGADLGYMGTPFIATPEARASDGYKQMVLAGGAEDIVATDAVTGISGNFLRDSIIAAGLDPERVARSAADRPDGGPDTGLDGESRAWRDIWSAGHGIGSVQAITPVAELVERIAREYHTAGRELAAGFAQPPASGT
ncbi:NAD(P)H-dependent flavin oxidoreductase [Pontibaca methylaminivorans]|uniref:NAD(P)H-dependent flavin oxidoreductase n=1 Tax=Pontibaca methylaminivorans TaxID=515897 RepID=UPI002FDAC1D5